MSVVSNAGPLIALGKLGQLGLLLKLYGGIPSPLPTWAQSIDIGEIEVITLAQQQSANLVLIDDIWREKRPAR